MVKVYVTTVLRQEIEAPDDYDTQDVYNFLAEHQDFSQAFCGVSTDAGTWRITDINVVDEEVD